MKRLEGLTRSAEMLSSHQHVCDLANVEFPILSLWTDGKRNWIYLWCEVSKTGRHRWMLFTVARPLLVSYLKADVPLLDLVRDARRHYVLEYTQSAPERVARRKKPAAPRRFLREVSLTQLADYLPASDSFFDESLTDQVDATQELTPTEYDLPIQGDDWFDQDLQDVLKRYQRIYAFFYATRPTFVRPMQEILQRRLRAPWTGGHSRNNLYSGLLQHVPALHALKIASVEYHSPGEVTFEAVRSIGRSIRSATLNMIENEAVIAELTKSIRKILQDAGVRKLDLKDSQDNAIAMAPERLAELTGSCKKIGSLLGSSDEFKTLCESSPNTVVYSKAVLSLVTQLDKLAEFQRDGMLNLSKPF